MEEKLANINMSIARNVEKHYELYRKMQENIDGCIKCNLCLSVCPVFKATGGSGYAGPRHLSAELLRHLLEFAPLVYDSSYLCTVCRHCEFVCPGNVNTPVAVLFLRRLLDSLKPPYKPAKDVSKGLETLVKLGNPYNTLPELKGEWLEEIDGKEGGKAKVLGWIGCTSSIRLPELAQGFYESMKKILGERGGASDVSCLLSLHASSPGGSEQGGHYEWCYDDEC